MDMLNAALMSAEQPSLEKCCDVVDAWHHHMRRIRAGANDGDLMLVAGCGQPAIAAPSVGVDQSTRHGCGLYEGQQAGAGHVLDAAKANSTNALASLFRSEEHTSELQSRFDLV